MATAPCPACHSQNPLGTSLCSSCGRSIAQICYQCGFENPGIFRFCGACGARLLGVADGSLGGGESRAQRTGREGERRHLSVMFCDLMDSTALSEELDPEDLRDTVKAYQEVCNRVIRRFEGSVAQYLGDGILAYFGYPVAHEDDARRAAKAGLEITREIRTLNRRLGREGDAELSVRIGIHTGLVVVGEVGAGDKRERLAMGQTPNIAARLQGLAKSNGVIISGATERLVRGFFRLEEAGDAVLKGVSRPVQIFHVKAVSGHLRALGPAAGWTPLVARERKLSLLLECWKRAEEGSGQTVLLRGEAGIGKSRLVEVFKEELGGKDYQLWELQSASYHQNSAFFPLTEALHRRLRRQGTASPEDEIRNLEEELRRLLFSVEQALPLLAQLLSLPLPAPYEPVRLAPTRLRRQTLEMLVRWVERLADRRPLLLVAEDLHWMDPSTVEFLGLLAERSPGTQLMLLATIRPDFQPGWAGREAVREVTINRLTTADSRALVRRLVGDRPLPDAVVAELAGRSDGNPLFLEELTKTFLESLEDRGEDRVAFSSEDPLRWLEIPHRLHDSLLARLDRLGGAKDVAQLGAILGRSFRLDFLRAVSTLESQELEENLERLVDADMLIPKDELDRVSYQFKHALLQEAAYQSLLKKQRRRYHWQVVQALEEHFPETVETEPEVLAHHCTEARLEKPAISYWQLAGELSAQRFANLEAQRHLHRGLELISAQPESSERDQRELPFQVILAPALIATRGFTAPEVEEAHLRARDLARQQPATPFAHGALRGLQRLHTARGDFQKARELGEEFQALARKSGDADLLAEAHLTLGAPLWHLGQLVEAQEQLEQALAHYEARQGLGQQAYLDAISPLVSCRVYSSYALWLLGYPDRAQATMDLNLAWARKLTHPMSLAVAHIGAAQVQVFRRQADEALAHTEAGIHLAQEHRIPTWKEMGLILKGRALAEKGAVESGMEFLTEGLEGWKASGVGFGYPLFLTLLAQVHRLAGDEDAALRQLERASSEVERTGECYLQAEIHRERGEILWSKGGDFSTQAISEIQKAVSIARQQQARSLELRAMVALTRIEEGYSDDLAAIVAGMEEGAGSVDHREALELLGQDAGASH